MTHDELWAKINHFKTVPFDPLLEALRAVVELHKPSENDSWGSCVCVKCPTWEYPCPTIEAIEKELS